MSAPAISTKRSSSVISLPGALAIAAVALAVAVMIALSFVDQPGAIRPAGFAASEMSAGLYQHTLRENSVSAAPAAPAGPNVDALYQHTLRENRGNQ